MCFCIGILLPRKRKSYIIHHRLHSLRPLARRSYFYLSYQFLPAYSTKFQAVTFIITGTNVSKWYKTAVYILVKFKYFTRFYLSFFVIQLFHSVIYVVQGTDVLFNFLLWSYKLRNNLDTFFSIALKY